MLVSALMTSLMLPKLTLLQWIVLVMLLAFYGFAVFALTRDYYLRHPPQAQLRATAGANQTPAAQDAALQQRMHRAVSGERSEIDINSTDATALGDAADRLFVARQFDQAIPVYRRVLELAPSDAETHNDLGLALHYIGRSSEAIEVLQRGSALAPDFQRIWLSLGFVALQMDNLGLGQDALERARALDPESEVGAEAGRLLSLIAGGGRDG